MEILYISSLSSIRLINKIQKESCSDPGFAVQKFNRFIALGLQHNGAKVKVYSKPPVGNIVGRTWVNESTEEEGGLIYNYIRYFNAPILKDILTFLFTFWQVFKFGLKNRKDKAVVCDVLAVSMNLGAVLASKLTRQKIVGIVTDMPGLMVSTSYSSDSFFKRIGTKISTSYLSFYSHYVFLTQQMNEVINTYNHPYIIMEALCDKSFNIISNENIVKGSPKIIMYAGGLYEQYGLKKLVDAFRSIRRNDIKLILFGSGPYATELQQIVEIDSRVEYRGVVTNEEVVRTELEATLLVNPRPSTEEFTKYSFPSKNIEYMVSGTPLLTTKLPGMPIDYYPYVYLFEDESEQGYATTLNRILSLPSENLISKGKNAMNYVLQNKNYVIQTSRILNLISE